ncbi:hypothetical protein VCR14J2_20090 [Vibrio coralliirubri]|nr:hypothetical protein VCR6J2_210046 [Vibrio coralliirubri]CDT62094.1 hypothetical protein VCR29J2_370093 [Vibrio coralliirubri]CDT90289.1 hypothetical protein VCR14J2_20090 [Vibrio coralliirubri]
MVENRVLFHQANLMFKSRIDSSIASALGLAELCYEQKIP